MLSSLSSKEQPSGASSNFLRRQIRWVLLLRVILFSFILGISSLLQAERHDLDIPPFFTVFIFILIIYLFSISSEYALRKKKFFRSFAFLQLLCDSIFISIVVYATGGNNSIFSIIYFFPVISGGILLHKRGGIVLASINTIFYGTILFSNYIPFWANLPEPYTPSGAENINILFQALSVYGLSFFLAAILSSILSERFSSTSEKLTQATQDLDLLNQLYKQIFDDISSGIITVDKNQKITSFNQAAEQITGFKKDEVLNCDIATFFPLLKAKPGDKPRHATTILKKDNKQIQVGYSWAKLNMPESCDDCRVYTLQDLSQIKEMEAKVQQAEKMAAIGEIAAGIAHEFRNPLAAISGAAQILTKDTDQSEVNYSLLNIINRECKRLECNINDFLQFSKPSTPEKKWLKVSTVIDESLSILKQIPGLNDGCRIKYNIPAHFECWADNHQLIQIIINLVHNSILALPDNDGEVTISAYETKIDNNGERTIIEVADNGHGIDKKTLDNIFNPFFTTRENGTGLGLAIVKQIIDSHKGEIEVDSNPGKATKIRIALPLPESD